VHNECAFGQGRETREVIKVETYVKAALYAYPILLTVEKEYGQHIENMAVLSYRSEQSAENLIEKIADEILVKDKLIRLKGTLESVLKELSATERTLLGLRYFGLERKWKRFKEKTSERVYKPWSESRYFRMQTRLLKKVGERLALKGFNKAEFEKSYAQLELFEKILRYIEKKNECVMSVREKRFLKME
jgi:hypothetical protein